MKKHKDAMSNIGQPAEPKPEVVECAIVELLDIARRQGITPADFYSIAGPRNASSGFLGSGEAGT
jgi:hypothetical protein